MGTTGMAAKLLAGGTEALMAASFGKGDFDVAQAALEAARQQAVADGDQIELLAGRRAEQSAEWLARAEAGESAPG